MSTYTKSLSSDFNNLFNISQMDTLVHDNATITTPFNGIIANGDDIIFHFEAALSAPEETELNTIITNYVYTPQSTYNTVKVLEEEIPTGGHYQIVSVDFDCAANSTTTHIHSFPVDINVTNGYLLALDQQRGDRVTVQVAPGTVIGAITANITLNDTVISVQASVIENTYIGNYLDFFDGTNTSNLVRVLSLDAGNNTVTVEAGIDQAFLAVTPTYVRATRIYAQDVYIPGGGAIGMGENKIGATHVEANRPIHFVYVNNQNVLFHACFIIEYLF